MNYKIERILKSNLSKKQKEELRHRISVDIKFRKELLSHCLLIKAMISIDKERTDRIKESIITEDNTK